MNEPEALRIVAVLQAGFPRTDWPPAHIALWVEELAAVGATEGQLAARALVRSREWPSVAAFMAEVAQVREMRLDAAPRGPMFGGPALESGDRVTPRQEGPGRVAEVREQLGRIGSPKGGRFRGEFIGGIWHYDDPEAVWADVPLERRPAGWDRQTPKLEPADPGSVPRRIPTLEELSTCRFEGCGLPSGEGDGWCSRHRPKEPEPSAAHEREEDT